MLRLFLLTGWLVAAAFSCFAGPILAEAGEPVRARDGRVDVAGTIDALRRENVNVYMYQIWRVATDWDQLPEFAEAAEAAGIEVWVYLVPWSETPLKQHSFAFPEPFKTDYIAWADAIGKMAHKHRAIRGWAMDDFYVNATQPDRFTDEYVDRMLAAGKRHHEALRFYPIVYFQQPWAEFTNRFAHKVDGVIACYPRSQDEVDNALRFLRGKKHGPSLLVTFTRKKQVKAGSIATITAEIPAHKLRGTALHLYFDDQTFGNQKGEHVAFVRVNGRTIWKRELGADKADCDVELPLHDLEEKFDRNVKLEIGAEVLETESDVLVEGRFSDIRILDRNGEMLDVDWRVDAPTSMNAEFAPPSRPRHDLNLPLLLLVGTLPMEHQKRYDEEPTIQNIRKKIHFALDNVKFGNAAGVVCWYTPKDDDLAEVRMVGDAFKAFKE